jgi:hypothetical protein
MVPDPRWFQCGSRSFFYLKADSDSDQPSQKVAFFNILSIHQKDSKIKTSLFWKTGNIGQFPCSWIRTHIPNKDSDPWEPSQSGSGSTTLVTCTKIGSKRPVFKILFLTNSADPDQRQWLQAVLRICDIKDRYGAGCESRSLDPYLWLTDPHRFCRMNPGQFWHIKLDLDQENKKNDMICIYWYYTYMQISVLFYFYCLEPETMLWIRIQSDSKRLAPVRIQKRSFRIRTAPDPKWIWSKKDKIWQFLNNNAQFKIHNVRIRL